MPRSSFLRVLHFSLVLWTLIFMLGVGDALAYDVCEIYGDNVKGKVLRIEYPDGSPYVGMLQVNFLGEFETDQAGEIKLGEIFVERNGILGRVSPCIVTIFVRPVEKKTFPTRVQINLSQLEKNRVLTLSPYKELSSLKHKLLVRENVVLPVDAKIWLCNSDKPHPTDINRLIFINDGREDYWFVQEEPGMEVYEHSFELSDFKDKDELRLDVPHLLNQVITVVPKDKIETIYWQDDGRDKVHFNYYKLEKDGKTSIFGIVNLDGEFVDQEWFALIKIHAGMPSQEVALEFSNRYFVPLGAEIISFLDMKNTMPRLYFDKSQLDIRAKEELPQEMIVKIDVAEAERAQRLKEEEEREAKENQRLWAVFKGVNLLIGIIVAVMLIIGNFVKVKKFVSKSVDFLIFRHINKAMEADAKREESQLFEKQRKFEKVEKGFYERYERARKNLAGSDLLMNVKQDIGSLLGTVFVSVNEIERTEKELNAYLDSVEGIESIENSLDKVLSSSDGIDKEAVENLVRKAMERKKSAQDLIDNYKQILASKKVEVVQMLTESEKAIRDGKFSKEFDEIFKKYNEQDSKMKELETNLGKALSDDDLLERKLEIIQKKAEVE